MPSSDDVQRLLNYYRSPTFDKEFLEKMAAGKEIADKHLLHLVDQMRANFAKDGYIPTGDDIALQQLFLSGGLGVDRMLELARSFGIAAVS